MTSDDMRVSKGLEFPEVALPGVGHMPAKGEDEKEAAWVLYLASTRIHGPQADIQRTNFSGPANESVVDPRE